MPILAFAQSDKEKSLFGFINSDRRQEGLKPLEWNETLHKVAVEHSRDMASQGEISHSGSDKSQPQDRVQRAGVFATRIAENVARDINIVSAHTSLMESVYHRENILDPELTEAAVGIVQEGQYLYVTEVFIRSIGELSLAEARDTLLQQMNRYRKERKLEPLILSRSLSNIAQSHVEVQENLNALSPPLLMNLLAKKQKRAVRVNVFTSGSLALPEEVDENLKENVQQVGIGFKRVRGKICDTGCYLVTLVFAAGVEE